MTSLLGMIREIAKNEINKLHTIELGVVESVSVRKSEDVETNYECSVILKGRIKDDGSPLKIEHVPIATQHTGFVNPPYVDDLVLVAFINGQFDTPVIIGRLYTDKKRVPIHKDCEYLLRFDSEQYQSKDEKFIISFKEGFEITGDKSAIKLQHGRTQIKTEKDRITIIKDKTRIVIQDDIKIECDGKVSINVEGDTTIKGKKITVDSSDISITSKSDVKIKCTNAKIDATNIELGGGGSGVITTASHRCFITGAPHTGSKSVKAKL